MADNPQSVGFSRGINTPTVSDVEQLVFKNGHNHRVSDFNLTYPGSGAGDLKFSLLVSPSIAAFFSLKLAVGGITCTVNLHASGKYAVDPLKMDAGVLVTDTSSDDFTVMKFKKAELVRTGTNIAVVVTLAINTTSTVVTGTVSAVGQGISLNVVPYSSLSSPTTFPHKYSIAQDAMAVKYFRDSTNVNIDLDVQINPGTFSCAPASASSKPSGTSGNGSCFVFGSSGYLAQLFVSDNGFSFTRYSTNGGTGWSAWNTLGDSTTINSKVDKTYSLGNVNPNAALTSGFFDFVSLSANFPSGFSGAGNLLVTSSGPSITQLLFSSTNTQFWMRTATNSASTWTWGSWSKFITSTDVDSAVTNGTTNKVDKATSSSSVDANTLITTGFYRSTVSSTNMPSDSTGKDTIIVSAVSNTVAQLVINQSTGRLWSRTGSFISSSWTWSAWVKAVGSDEISSLVSLTTLNRGAYLRETNNGTLAVNKRYGIWTGGGAITMNMPSVANCANGDEIVLGNLDCIWGTNAFTINCPTGVRFQNPSGAEDATLICNTGANVQGITLYCVWNDGSRARWVIMG